MGTCAVTGTVGDGAVESEIVAGGGTIILTLTGETWIATGSVDENIGNPNIEVTGSDLAANTVMIVGRYTAVNSGTLDFGYVYKTNATASNGRLLVYLDGDNDDLVDVSDTLVASSAQVSNESGTGWITFTFSSGNIVAGNKYWIVFTQPVGGANWGSRTDSSGTSGKVWFYETSEEWYTSPPANMSTIADASSDREYSMYVHIS